MADISLSTTDPPCPMCNDKQGMGAPPKPKVQVIILQYCYRYNLTICYTQSTACKRCLGCKTCSAQMTPGEKYSCKLSDEQIESYKETFRMFDKVTCLDIKN